MVRRNRRGLLAPLPPECKPGNDAISKGLYKGMTGPPGGERPTSSPLPPGRATTMPIALFEPDIPQNTGTILRLAACLGIEAHLIEPAGFPTSDRAFRRAGMDYLDAVKLVRHPTWESFAQWRTAEGMRLVLFTTGATTSYLDHRYEPTDILLFGRESAGVPAHVHAAAKARLRIPMKGGLRSLNVAMTCAMAVGEALRQTGGFGRG
jgi:tRNA (cytidine/uridine-2'-O-)-methyltransferase